MLGRRNIVEKRTSTRNRTCIRPNYGSMKREKIVGEGLLGRRNIVEKRTSTRNRRTFIRPNYGSMKRETRM